MKKAIIILAIIVLKNFAFSQTLSYKSTNYRYSIEIPNGFKKESPKSVNNDMIFTDEFGASITVVVVNRDYKTNTPHDLNNEFFLEIFQTVDPNVFIFDDVKIFVNGKKAYRDVKTIKFEDTPVKLNQMNVTFYDEIKAYIFTLSCATKDYNKYKELFIKCSESIKFK